MTAALFIWGFIQSFIVGVSVPAVKKTKNNYLLSSIFIVTSLNIFFQYFFRFAEAKHDFIRLLVAPDFLDLLLPTLVLVYIKSFVADTDVRKSYSLFLVPIIWATVLWVFVLGQKNFGFSSYIDTQLHLASLVIVLLWKLFLLAQALPYCMIGQTLTAKRRRWLLWPRTLVLFMGLITYIGGCNLAFFVIRRSGYELQSAVVSLRSITTLNYIVFTCFLVFISIYFFLDNPRMLAGLSSTKPRDKEGLQKDTRQLNDILEAIEKDRLYLDTELNESRLAEKLAIPSYILSKLLNEHLGKSFNEFINEKRIAEAKRLLADQKSHHITIFAVAVDCGFKSESGFYVNFKKLTGMTPGQYRKRCTSG